MFRLDQYTFKYDRYIVVLTKRAAKAMQNENFFKFYDWEACSMYSSIPKQVKTRDQGMIGSCLYLTGCGVCDMRFCLANHRTCKRIAIGILLKLLLTFG